MLTSGAKEKLIETLRCPACLKRVDLNDGAVSDTEGGAVLACVRCGHDYPILDGIPRMLLSPLKEALLNSGEVRGTNAKQVKTAFSFGYEWQNFPEMYAEWEKQFFDYMQPRTEEFFKGKKVLDAGCGNGRFAFYAAKYGAEVWAIDLGPAVEVAQRNVEPFENAHVIQADLHQPPFALESFDFIYSIGVLHHLPDPEAAFHNLLRYLKPGGEIQIYLYWKPEGQRMKQVLLAAVNFLRGITTRLPHAAVLTLAFPAAFAAHLFFVWPYELFRSVPPLRGFAEKFPMKQYAAFPFRVCVNDQLDRFSAPIENRYTKREVSEWLQRAGLGSVRVEASYGWIGSGRK